MKPSDREFGRQFAKALGEGPGPRAVEAQKERVLAAADRARRHRTGPRLVLLVAGLAAVGAILWRILH